MSVVLDGPGDSVEFLFGDRITLFGIVQGFTSVGNNTFAALVVRLSKDNTKSIVRGVGVEDERFRRVRPGEYGSGGERQLDFVKSFLLSWCPVNGLPFSDDVPQGFGQVTKVRDELAVIS